MSFSVPFSVATKPLTSCLWLSSYERCKSLKTGQKYNVSYFKRLSNFLKQLVTVVFNQTLLKQEEIVHLLGNIFSGSNEGTCHSVNSVAH